MLQQLAIDSGPVHFLSDLHLPPGSPDDALVQMLLRYLAVQARSAHAVVLLGDIFDAWLGDDVMLDDAAAVVDALQSLSKSGVAVYAMRGNRDFLLGSQFAAAIGGQLLDDPCVLTLGATRIVLTHGDLLCTDDEGYQRYRRIVHNRWMQRGWYCLPRALRTRIAKRIRGTSKRTTALKPSHITNVNAQAVAQMAATHDVQLMIHGHTHRPAAHRSPLPGKRDSLLRWVLEDWRDATGAAVLVAEAGSDGSPQFSQLRVG